MSVTERIGTKPSWAAAILVALLVSTSVACGGSAAAPDDSTVHPVVETDGDPEPQPTVAPALDTDQFDLPGILVQYDYEPTFSTPESFQPFGRVPPFTMLEDGTLIYLDDGRRYDERRVMEVHLSGYDADALVQQVLDLGFERLGNHAEQCENLDDGSSVCIADASYTVLRVRLPSGEPRQGGILKKCVNGQAVYPLSEQDGLKAQERRYTAYGKEKH